MRYRPLLLAAAALVMPAAAPAALHPLLGATVVVGPPPKEETVVAQLLGMWDRARAQHDARYLNRLVAEDFTAVTAAGERLDRHALLTRGTPERGASMVTSEDVKVSVAGDTATATAKVTSVIAERGIVTLETLTFRRDPDPSNPGAGWRILRSVSIPHP
ncbi:MAG TPA: nuclear transport factor 2 family protein [Allosphingosinicella sp.]|jgi:ketosteroid isomerase-like protein